MIVARTPLPFAITEPSQVGEARRQILGLAGLVGLDAGEQGRLALVVNELGSNLVKHAGGGELLVRALEAPGAIEVLALDRGAGMASVAECFRDGYSTAGSPGTGLGAVDRLASLMDVYSAQPGGTAILARVDAHGRREARALPVQAGGVSVPKTGEDVCGDGFSVAADAACPAVMVVDGLGHGPGAADAARLAVACFESAPERPPAEQVAVIHDALRGSRGAAVAVARIDPARGVVAYSGIGNIGGAIVAGDATRHLVSGNGTAGHNASRINEFAYPWPDAALLVMHSDGLVSRWQIERYPGLPSRHPA
ncbi:MAG TPA: SpoIIE family protein phosphatase, partial [Methylomirabilota bacterium]|nr:SpoIIE family protein phosphatase [Methylomirabilota bacterium]